MENREIGNRKQEKVLQFFVFFVFRSAAANRRDGRPGFGIVPFCCRVHILSLKIYLLISCGQRPENYARAEGVRGFKRFRVSTMFAELLTCCFPCLLSTTPTISINSTSFKLLNVLGEGSYSIVYLVQSNSIRSQRLYALKKIRTISTSSTQRALNEISYYGQFKSPYIINVLDSSSIQELDGSRSIYILLPYFSNGSLQDLINSTILDENLKLSEYEILRIFSSICRGVLTLHNYHMPRNNSITSTSTSTTNLIDVNDIDNDYGGSLTELSETIPYAHFDLKPENIFMSNDGTPIIGDLGSCSPARIHINSRAQAISFQELVEENSTPEYRAPELFDIKRGDSFDERVDVWSLGCILYTMLYGVNPFTREVKLRGANLRLAVQGGQWGFPEPIDAPDAPRYSAATRRLVAAALVTCPADRPRVDRLLEAVELSAV